MRNLKNRYFQSHIQGYQNEILVSHLFRRNEEYLQLLKQSKLIDQGLLNSLLAISLCRTYRDTPNLNIVDLGGGGVHLYETLRLLHSDIVVNSAVIETPAIVCRFRGLETQSLRFFTLDEYFIQQWFESPILIANSSLQYLEDPLKTLLELRNSIKPEFIFIGKTPFHPSAGYVRGTQISQLNSNGPKGFFNSSKNQKVAYQACAISQMDFNELFKDDWDVVYRVEDGKFDLKHNLKSKHKYSYKTQSLLLRRRSDKDKGS